MSEMQLPDSWIPTTFDSVIASVTNGVGGKQNKDGIGLAVSRIETIADQKVNFSRVGFLAEYDKDKIEKYRLNDGDILFSHINSPIHLGKTAIFTDGKPLYHGINLLRVVVDRSLIYPELFNYYCKLTRSQGEFSMQAQHAVNQSSINQKKLAQFDIPLPPLAEQREIADRLDTLLAQVDTLKGRLDALPAILKRFRQSVLAAAVNGKLTEEWRSGEIFECESNELGHLAKFVDYRGKTPKKTDSGIPLITAKNIRKGFISREPREFIAESDYEPWMTRGIPSYGDVLITTEAPMGYVANVDIEEKFALAQRAICLQFKSGVSPYYAAIYMQAPEFQKRLDLNSTGSTVKGIKAALLKRMLIEYPSLSEQTEIVRRVEQLFSFADQVELRVKDAQSRVNHLTQSILAKAFRGELTADWRQQHPELITGEHSAEALLARIQAERASHISAQTSAKRGRKKASA